MRLRLLPLTLITLATASLLAQDGVSTAGAARSRYLGALGILPTKDEVLVEDFVNYHRHEIARPKAGEAVGLDLRWQVDSARVRQEGLVLQVGLATSLVYDRTVLPPINLSLVIDKSGSMAAADKLNRVKQALLTMIEELRPEDRLSIVTFDSEAQVLLSGEQLGDKVKVKQVIRSLTPGSSTNIHAGLMLGYQLAREHLVLNGTNRVILLTDGIANQGVTEPKEITAASKRYNEMGVDLSTIGLGLDIQKDMLRTLAKEGRGLHHFVADDADIQKVFSTEVQSLLSPAAGEPEVEISYGKGLELKHIYGYEPTLADGKATLQLPTMNSGATQVVLLRFNRTEAKEAAVQVKLSYLDMKTKRRVTKTEKITLPNSKEFGRIKDPSVTKNYIIAELAQSLRDMAAASDAKQYVKAESLVQQALYRTHAVFPYLEDEDVTRTYTIAQQYLEALHKLNAANLAAHSIIPNGDFSQGNTGFTSGLPYHGTAENSLWAHGYTIASRFDQPHLHRLIPREAYAPAQQYTGYEQVMFANAGGVDHLLMWASSFPCKPNTRYRISFYAMSLNEEPEWIPSYEIQINGARSTAQLAGRREYKLIMMEWDSGTSTTANLNLIRLPMGHNGGLVAISNIMMVPLRDDLPPL